MTPLQGKPGITGVGTSSTPPQERTSVGSTETAGQPAGKADIQSTTAKPPLERTRAMRDVTEQTSTAEPKRRGSFAAICAKFTNWTRTRGRSASATRESITVSQKAASSNQSNTDLKTHRDAYNKVTEQTRALEQKFARVKDAPANHVRAKEALNLARSERLLSFVEIDRRRLTKMLEQPDVEVRRYAEFLNNETHRVKYERDVQAGHAVKDLLSDTRLSEKEADQRLQKLEVYIREGYTLSPEAGRLIGQRYSLSNNKTSVEVTFDNSLEHLSKRELKNLRESRLNAFYQAQADVKTSEAAVTEHAQLRESIRDGKTLQRLAHLDLAIMQATLMPEETAKERTEKEQVMTSLAVMTEAEEAIKEYQSLKTIEQSLSKTDPEYENIQNQMRNGRDALKELTAKVQDQKVALTPRMSPAMKNTQNHLAHTEARLQLSIGDPSKVEQFGKALFEAESRSQEDLNAV